MGFCNQFLLTSSCTKVKKIVYTRMFLMTIQYFIFLEFICKLINKSFLHYLATCNSHVIIFIVSTVLFKKQGHTREKKM